MNDSAIGEQTTAAPATAGPTAAAAAVLDRFAAAFATLGALLVRPVEAPFLHQLATTDLLEHWPVRGDAASETGLALLARSVSDGEELSALRADYNRLFVGPGPLVAPPYESVYRSDEGLVFEAETMQVRARYAAWDVRAPRLNREPDDHIGLELEFLATLCLRALDALDAGDTALLGAARTEIGSFLDEHVLQWAPLCMRKAAGGAQTAFYQGVTALVQGTLDAAGRHFPPVV